MIKGVLYGSNFYMTKYVWKGVLPLYPINMTNLYGKRRCQINLHHTYDKAKFANSMAPNDIYLQI